MFAFTLKISVIDYISSVKHDFSRNEMFSYCQSRIDFIFRIDFDQKLQKISFMLG